MDVILKYGASIIIECKHRLRVLFATAKITAMVDLRNPMEDELRIKIAAFFFLSFL